MKANRRRVKQQHGFTIVQMVITIAIIAIVTTFGVLGIKNARAEYRLQSSSRLFATYIEKARQDAIRRHPASGSESSVESFEPGTNTYAVTMDWGSGTVETRTFQLESGLSFDTAAKKVSFDWRGRITEAWVFQIHSQYLNRNMPIDVSGSGDITVGEQHFPDQMIPAVEISQVSGDVDTSTPTPSPTASTSPTATPSPQASPSATANPSPTATPNNNGNGNGPTGNNGNGNGNGNATPTPTATPVASPSATPIAQCVSAISPSTLSLSQSDATKQTGTATFTMTNATGVRIISASQAGNGNALVISLSLARIEGSGSSVISVTTKNGSGNRGTFVVNVAGTPACGNGAQLTVSVSN
jgi:type II secretory pathway pseudopilin PulG